MEVNYTKIVDIKALAMHALKANVVLAAVCGDQECIMPVIHRYIPAVTHTAALQTDNYRCTLQES